MDVKTQQLIIYFVGGTCIISLIMNLITNTHDVTLAAIAILATALNGKKLSDKEAETIEKMQTQNIENNDNDIPRINEKENEKTN